MSGPLDSAWPPRANARLGSREGFSQLKARAYLAHCAISPLSDPVRQAITQVADSFSTLGFEAFCDAIQALGIVPMDLSKSQVDYLAAGSHKWLMGTTGSSILYISPQRIKQLRPVLAGWLSHEQPLDFLFEPDQLSYDRPIRAQADAVESGTQPDISLAALQCFAVSCDQLGEARSLRFDSDCTCPARPKPFLEVASSLTQGVPANSELSQVYIIRSHRPVCGRKT